MLIKKIREIIRRFKLFDFGDKVLVGVSGGPDSVALLFVLCQLRYEFGLNIHVAHLDHGLRKCSKLDAEFVKKLAKKLNLPITVAKIKVRNLAKNRSLEEVAREARLNYFFKVAKKIKADKIALGHNKDDQAETVLMRIIRGSGLEGLRAILPKRTINDYTVVRPLIEVSRKEIEGFLKKNNLKPRIDKTNFETEFFRNKIRHILIPYLKRFNPNIKDVLSDFAQNAGVDYEYLINGARVALGRSRVPALLESRKGPRRRRVRLRRKRFEVNIKLDKFLKYPLAVQRMVVRLAIRELKKDTRRITYQHWREIEDLVSNRPLNSIVNLPGKIVVSKSKGTISVLAKQA
ncbi:MAG: tRNA lysidine(34) synthetase TilS [Candidatus Omnitrophota bacterium]